MGHYRSIIFCIYTIFPFKFQSFLLKYTVREFSYTENVIVKTFLSLAAKFNAASEKNSVKIKVPFQCRNDENSKLEPKYKSLIFKYILLYFENKATIVQQQGTECNSSVGFQLSNLILYVKVIYFMNLMNSFKLQIATISVATLLYLQTGCCLVLENVHLMKTSLCLPLLKYLYFMFDFLF